MNRDARALAWLTLSTVQRMLREGLVVRSLAWPGVLASGTLLGTVLILAIYKAPDVVGYELGSDPAHLEAARSAGFGLVEVSDAAAAVRSGEVSVGLAPGRIVRTPRHATEAIVVEAEIRKQAHARWRPTASLVRPGIADTAVTGSRASIAITVLFILYGAVFGLGMVARDRDDGTLLAEFSLPISRWVPGMARWVAATVVLNVFHALTVTMLTSLLGILNLGFTVGHGAAAISMAVSVGLMVAGSAGLSKGFSSAFAGATALVAGLIGLGVAVPAAGTMLPIASIFSDGHPGVPLGVAALVGIMSTAIFGYRSGRA